MVQKLTISQSNEGLKTLSESVITERPSKGVNIVSMMKPMRATLQSTFTLAGINAEALIMLDDAVLQYLDLASSLQTHHGPEGATKQLKALNSMILHWMTEQTVRQLGIVNIKLNKKGKPLLLNSSLSKLSKLLYSDEIYLKRLGLSVLRGFELVRGTPKYDINTIKGITTGAKSYITCNLDSEMVHENLRGQNFRGCFRNFLQTSRYGRLKRRLFEEELKVTRTKAAKSKHNTSLYFTTKAGPRGFAVGSLGRQSLDIGPKLKEILSPIAEYFGLPKFREELEYHQSFAKGNAIHDLDLSGQYYDALPTGVLGRLSVYPDKGWKHRLMAICNTWIQMPLKPAHDTLLRVLQRIPSDGSWDQDKASERIRLATISREISSLDLKDATNLIPAIMQADSLCNMDNIFTTWLDIAQKTTFLNPETDEVMSYNTGQPMGLYTSFAGLAHWHNDIYQFAYYLVTGNKQDIFQDFAVLGDDSCCWDTRVTAVYRYLLTLLAIEVSEGKSYVSVSATSNRPRVAEFAKRTFANGIEITGMSTTLANSVFGTSGDSNLEYIPSLCRNLFTKGWIQKYNLLTFETFKKSIKRSTPLVGAKRIKALYALTMIEICYGIPTKDTPHVSIEYVSIKFLSELIENKIDSIKEKLGPTWAKVPILRGTILSRSHSMMTSIPTEKYYPTVITDIILKGLISVYEQAALSVISRDQLTMLEFLLEYREVQDVRELTNLAIFSKSKKCKIVKSKRQKAQSALYRLISFTLNSDSAV